LERESGDYIKGCDGTWIHAIGSLAGADGWNITNVAAFTFLLFVFWQAAIQPSSLRILCGRPQKLPSV
jgi:hypothetical protein